MMDAPNLLFSGSGLLALRCWLIVCLLAYRIAGVVLSFWQSLRFASRLFRASLHVRLDPACRVF